MNNYSITDHPLGSPTSYNKGEVYETRYDDAIDDTESYRNLLGYHDESILTHKNKHDYSNNINTEL